VSDRIVRESRYSFRDTVATLTEAIETGGGIVFTTIDQAAAAKAVGLELQPTTLIVFGNPKGGTPLMDAFPLAALELPLKVLVWEEHGRVSVAYVPVAAIAKRYDVAGKDALLAAMAGSLEGVVAAVT
jgi:uncharacterized protein (DUF302 family)